MYINVNFKSVRSQFAYNEIGVKEVCDSKFGQNEILPFTPCYRSAIAPSDRGEREFHPLFF